MHTQMRGSFAEDKSYSHLRKRRKTDILRRINIGSEAFKLLLSVFFSRHEAMICRP